MRIKIKYLNLLHDLCKLVPDECRPATGSKVELTKMGSGIIQVVATNGRVLIRSEINSHDFYTEACALLGEDDSRAIEVTSKGSRAKRDRDSLKTLIQGEDYFLSHASFPKWSHTVPTKFEEVGSTLLRSDVLDDLNKAVKLLKWETVHFAYSGEESPIYVSPSRNRGESDFILVMPMRNN